MVPGRNWWFAPGAWAGTGCQQDRSSEKTNCFQTLEPFVFFVEGLCCEGKYLHDICHSANSWRFGLVVHYSNIDQRHQLTAFDAYFGKIHYVSSFSLYYFREVFFVHTARSKKFLTSTKAKSWNVTITSEKTVAISLSTPIVLDLWIRPKLSQNLSFSHLQLSENTRNSAEVAGMISWSPFHTRLPMLPTFFPNFSARTSGGRKSSYRSPNPEIHHFFVDGRPGAGDTLRELPFTLPASRPKQKYKTPKCRNKII